MVTAAKLAPWKKSYDQPRQHIKKRRHYFANKGPSSQSYGFSSIQVWMWELDHKESWVLKNLCSWAAVLEKTLESPLDCKEIQPVNPKGDQSWIFMAESEAPIVWPPDAKNWLIGKDPDAGKDCRQEEKGTTEDEIVGWHHRLNGHMFEHALGVGDGQGSLVCCNPLGHKELDMTEQLNWAESPSHIWLFWTVALQAVLYFTVSWSLLRLMPSESVMPSNHLIFCCPLLLLPSVFPSIRVFSNELALCIRWSKYWSFSFIISSSNEYSGYHHCILFFSFCLHTHW